MARTISIHNLNNAEDNAMLCALRSRSDAPITELLEKVEDTGSGKFMSKYLIEYGHRSISQCGFTTIHLDNISILAAKAIENSQLFNGQECSSRYLNFSDRETHISHPVVDNWLAFYTKAKEPLIEHLKLKYPNVENVADSIYDKAIIAKSFDILRGFLPAAVTTNVSWVTNLDQLAEQIEQFRFHPLKEMNEIANELHALAMIEFPNSFSDKSPTNNQLEYNAKMSNFWYSTNIFNTEFTFNSNIDNHYIDPVLMEGRPKHGILPMMYKFFGEFRFEFNIDYGAFRDIQRHRSSLIYQPLLTAKLGFHPWYIDQLPEALKNEALELIEVQSDIIKELGDSTKSAELQYYIPLGMLVSVVMVSSLNALVYLVELRSSKHVHPTLRKLVFKMADAIKQQLPDLKLHIDDTDVEEFDTIRGSQDIVSKNLI